MDIKKPDQQSYDSDSESSKSSVREDTNTEQQLDNEVESSSELPNNISDPGDDLAEMPGYKGQVRATGSGVSCRQSSAAGSKRVDRTSAGADGATAGKGPAPSVAPKTKASVGRVTSHTEATKEESARKPAQNGTEKKLNKSSTTKDQPTVLTKPTDKSKIPKKPAPEALPKPNKTPSISMSPDASVSSPLQTRETTQAERSKSSSSNSVTKPQWPQPSSPPGKSETESPAKEDTTELEPGKAQKPSYTNEPKKEKDLKCIKAEEKTEQPDDSEEAKETCDDVKPKIQTKSPTDKTPKSKPGKITLSKSSKVNKTETDNKPHTPTETEQPEKSGTKDKATNETRTIGPKKLKAEASPTGSRLPRLTPPPAPKQPTEGEFDYGEAESHKQPSLFDARPENDDSSSVNGPLNPAERAGNAVGNASPETKALPHLKRPSKLKSKKEVEKVKAEPAADSQTTVQVSEPKPDKAEAEKPSVSLEASAPSSEENQDTVGVTQVKDQSVKLNKEKQCTSVKINEPTADQTPPEELHKAKEAHYVSMKTTEHSVDIKTPREASNKQTDQAEAESSAQVSKKKTDTPEPDPCVEDKTEEPKTGLKLTQETKQKPDQAEAEPSVDNKTKDLKLTPHAERKPRKAKEEGKEVTAPPEISKKQTQVQEVQNAELKTSSQVSESKAEVAENMQSVEKTKDQRTDQEQKMVTAEELPKAEVKTELKPQPKESTQKANKGEELRRTSDLTPSQTSDPEVDKASKVQERNIKSVEDTAHLNDSQVTEPLDISAPIVKPGLINKETLPGADKETPAPVKVDKMPVRPTASVRENTEDLKTGNLQKSNTAEVTQDALKSKFKERNNNATNVSAAKTLSETTEEAGHKEAGAPVSAQDHTYEPEDITSCSTEAAATGHHALKSLISESVKEDVQSSPVSKTEPDKKPAKKAEQPKATEQVTSQIEKTTDVKTSSTTNQKPDSNKSSKNSPKSEKLLPPNKNSPKITAEDFLLVSKKHSRNESPSSWLDVDQGFEKKQIKTGRKMDCSASDESLMDTSDDSEDFIRKIKELCSPFSFPPKKHGKSRMISPPFAMPAIKEDHFEKTFDPEEFKFGMRKTTGTKDLSPAMLMKKKTEDVKKQLPKRKGTEDSVIFKALSLRRGQEKNDEEKPTENTENAAEDQGKAESSGKLPSRIERMSILSNLRSSSKNLSRTQTQPEVVSNGATSTTASQQVLTPSNTNSVVSEAVLPVKPEGISADLIIQPGLAADSPKSPLTPPSLPNFSEIKLTDFIGKYLKMDKESTPSGSSQKPELPSALPAEQTEVSSGVPDTNRGLKNFPEPPAPVFPPKPPEQQSSLPSPASTQVSRKLVFPSCFQDHLVQILS